MSGHEHSTVWARLTDLLPAEFGAAGWALWGLSNGLTLFGDESHLAVLRTNLDDPAGEGVTDDGVTKAEVLAVMIYTVLLGTWVLLASGLLATPLARRLERRLSTLLKQMRGRRSDTDLPAPDVDADQRLQ